MEGKDGNDSHEFTVDNITNYLKFKIPILTLTGGIYGASLGYYMGGLTALYGYGYGLGCGVVGSAFYFGTYSLKCIRKQDDYLNYMASGGVNASWLATGMYGPRRGMIAAVAGMLVGGLYKIGGDITYQLTRNAWLEHRIHVLYKSKPRILTVRRALFPPREGHQDVAHSRQGDATSIIPSQFINVNRNESKDKEN